MGKPGSFCRPCQCCLVHPLGACQPGQRLCRPLGTGMAAGLGMAGSWLQSLCLCSGCRSTGLHHCLWCSVESGLDLMLCSRDPRALAPHVPTAPSALRHEVPGGSGMPGAPCTQSLVLDAEPPVVLAIVSVQCLALQCSLTAMQQWG